MTQRDRASAKPRRKNQVKAEHRQYLDDQKVPNFRVKL